MRRNFGLAQTFLTPVVLLVTLLSNPGDPVPVLADRALETLLGAVVGMTVAVLLRERPQPAPDA